MYPCENNKWLSFVCVHPESESHTTSTDGTHHPLALQKKQPCLPLASLTCTPLQTGTSKPPSTKSCTSTKTSTPGSRFSSTKPARPRSKSGHSSTSIHCPPGHQASSP
jgi:hypothetical protein